MTTRPLSPEKIATLYNALHRIAQYQSPEELDKKAVKQYGLDPDEAIRMAYENVIHEAKNALTDIHAIHLQWFEEMLQRLVDDRLERIAIGFEAWATLDIWRSDAVEFVRTFKTGPMVPAKVIKR